MVIFGVGMGSHLLVCDSNGRYGVSTIAIDGRKCGAPPHAAWPTILASEPLMRCPLPPRERSASEVFKAELADEGRHRVIWLERHDVARG